MTVNGKMSKWEKEIVVAKLIAERCDIKLNAPIQDRYGYKNIETFEDLIRNLLAWGANKAMIEDIIDALGFREHINELCNEQITKRNIELELAGKKPLPLVK